MNKLQKEIDNILQTHFPDDYYEELRCFVFCTRCGRPVKLTKHGRYMRHGYSFSIANKTYSGVPIVGRRIEKNPPCMNSGEKYIVANGNQEMDKIFKL